MAYQLLDAKRSKSSSSIGHDEKASKAKFASFALVSILTPLSWSMAVSVSAESFQSWQQMSTLGAALAETTQQTGWKRLILAPFCHLQKPWVKTWTK